MSQAGALLAARFSFMPNRLGYCGPEENRAMLDYVAAGAADRGLAQILARFAGAFPYYSFIAAANGIGDPFDVRVIEAYWIGNELLENVELHDLHRHLSDRFGRRFPPRVLQAVLGIVPRGARPHHNFHVLSMPIRTGHLEIPHTLETLDECRISWGRVLAEDGDGLLVERRPLVLEGDALALGSPAPRRVLRRFGGKALVSQVRPGDTVAIHWGCACHVLTLRQRRFLVQYTRHHLALTNEQRRGAVILER
ncbi:MAG: DUF6390 family protein [Armatimonadota bacterium]|nr:DUF6390 family protein [Armatimonadota bacterium]MDR7486738.1 DUF6390 family protein [Armatimonadota bacterium]MDR7534282.1 DUF6390 family protein [Armatimonadota bacterium]MDR7535367.1 DUF6390 family protein [Armatimonadota bacterium]